MPYLYHQVRKAMRGTTLYPLNVLKEHEPDLYEKYAEGYEGREFLLRRRLPVLNCLWNDVMHLMAVNPALIVGALRETGFADYHLRFYEIPAELIDPAHAMVFLFKPQGIGPDGKKLPPTPDEFIHYDPNKLADYEQMPQGTIDHYRKRFAEGVLPMTYQLIPHILYQGTIDVSSCPIIEP